MRKLYDKNGVIYFYKTEGNKWLIVNSEDKKQASYIKIKTNRFDIDAAEKLLGNGCSFHDRKLCMEIDIKATAEMRKKIMEKLIQFPMHVSDEITEEMYILAYQAFKTDRRFHLEHQFDSELASQIICAYINSLRERKIKVVKAVCERKLLGYMIIEDWSGGIFENILGVTRPDMQGKMVAYGLYNYALEVMSQKEYGNYGRYYGEVSSINLESINLHIQLGAKVKDIYDEYIWRNAENIVES